jgi:L-ascorbate metabolism protein UlaG (beta-lactamase superfamily)
MRRSVGILLVVLATATTSSAGAPRASGRFHNTVGPRPMPGPQEMLPFFLRKAWTSIVPRSGGAPAVAYDPAALAHNPSITWIGHSTMLVRMGGMTFLTDPVFSDTAGPAPYLGPRRHVAPGIALSELPQVDFALVSHDHYDHADFPSIAALARRGVRFVVPLELGALVREAGGSVVELDWWEETKIGEVTVHCVPAQHFSGRSLTDGNRRLWAGWVVDDGKRRFYHAGDTGYFEGFSEIGRRVGPIDLAAVPIGAYRPSAIMRYVHMDPAEAIQAFLDLGAQNAIGMHYGTFDLTDEPMDEPPRWFHAEAERRGIDPGRIWTPKIGETLGF